MPDRVDPQETADVPLPRDRDPAPSGSDVTTSETQTPPSEPSPAARGPDEVFSLAGSWACLEVIEPLGHGGFGRVYRARDPVLAREVALKIIDIPARDPARMADVLHEGRLLARLRHPNVVTVYGAQECGGAVGIWMELIRGQSLAELVRSAGPFGPEEAIAIGVSVCRALAAVHAQGLIHRDVKARNVMREAGGRIVLMDFGAGWEPGDSTHAREVSPAGTPLYMAPELLAGQPPTAASDLYSVGVLLFFLVTGTHPVDGRTITDIVLAHGLGRRRLLTDCRPDLPDAFVRVVERALSPSPDRRHASAGAMMRELGDALPGADGAWGAAEPGRAEPGLAERAEVPGRVERALPRTDTEGGGRDVARDVGGEPAGPTERDRAAAAQTSAGRRASGQRGAQSGRGGEAGDAEAPVGAALAGLADAAATPGARDPGLAREAPAPPPPAPALQRPVPAAWWTRPVGWLGLAAGVAGGVWTSGLLVSLTFDISLGRAGGFGDPVSTWWLWGLRSLVAPLVYVLGAVIVVRAAGFLARTLVRVVRAETRVAGIGRRVAALVPKIGLDHPVAVGQLVLVLQLAFLAWAMWAFFDLIAAFTAYLDSADPARIAPLDPGHSGRHSDYRMLFPLVAFAMAIAWSRVWRWRRRRGVTGDRVTVIAGVALLVFTAVLGQLPYRLFQHSAFQRVAFEGERCYAIGQRGGERLLYCPDVPPPRVRVVAAGDARLERSTVVESIFAPRAAGDGRQ